jgi:signal peptidase I
MTVLLAVAAAVVACCTPVVAVRRWIAIVTVAGLSMQPALAAGDRVLVRRTNIDRVRRGQIVVIEKPDADGAWPARPPRWPVDGREWLIKRVAAVPGDPAPAELLACDLVSPGQLVPSGLLAVLGDNAAVSLDSRRIGYIPAERLVGVMVRPLQPQAST